MPSKSTMEQTDKFYKNTQKQSPKFSMGGKPDFIVGGDVPSWKKSIPGPKYEINTDAYKPSAPRQTFGTRPEMVVGGTVPSWTNSIPGPKYKYDTDLIRQRQPVFSMGGRPKEKEDKKIIGKSLTQAALRLTDGFNATHKKAQPVTLKSRTEFIVGGDVPSWKASIPGPYGSNPDCVKKAQPNYTIGRKLKSEADLMKARSPGPQAYNGPATNAKLQAEVDSTKRRSFAPGFGSMPRFEGTTAEMAASGALHRYERPLIRR